MSPRDPFEELLGRTPLPEPDAGFRAEMRGRFLALGADDDGAGGADRKSLSQAREAPRSRGAVDPDLEALLARDPLPRAREAARAELRERFLSHSGQDPSGDVLAPVSPVAGARRPVSLLRRIVVFTAAAAAFLFVTFYLPREPRWRLEDFHGGDSIEVAGASLGARDADRIADALTRGASLDSREAQLDLGLAEGLEVRVLPGTRVELGALPTLDGSEPIVLSLDRGEVYVKTTDGYPGNPILIETPEQRVRVTGTVLGVMRDEHGTCCCVARGYVEVEDLLAGGELRRVGTCQSLMAFQKNGGHGLRDWDHADDSLKAHTAPLLAFAGP